jgi:hypothetical protein
VGWTGWCPASCFQNESSCLYIYIHIYISPERKYVVCVGVPVVYVCSKTSLRALCDVFLNAKGSKKTISRQKRLAGPEVIAMITQKTRWETFVKDHPNHI